MMCHELIRVRIRFVVMYTRPSLQEGLFRLDLSTEVLCKALHILYMEDPQGNLLMEDALLINYVQSEPGVRLCAIIIYTHSCLSKKSPYSGFCLEIPF